MTASLNTNMMIIQIMKWIYNESSSAGNMIHMESWYLKLNNRNIEQKNSIQYISVDIADIHDRMTWVTSAGIHGDLGLVS